MTAETPISDSQALSLAGAADSGHSRDDLSAQARVRGTGLFGRVVTYSPKVFLPLTNLCRNRCDYCSFRKSPGESGSLTMAKAQVERQLDAAAKVGCIEALICIGDKPEGAFSAYRDELGKRGLDSTVDFIDWASEQALARGLLPHTNAGVLSRADMVRLRRSNVSLGLMLESVSERLCERGMPHFRAPDKRPKVRLEMLRQAGELRIAVTTGILIGIGETRLERIQSLLAIRELHREHGHIQEVIVQNFVPRSGIVMAELPGVTDAEMAWTVAAARLILDDDVSLQAPPNLNSNRTRVLVDAGINDLGGISPVTVDYINPEQPWPKIARLSGQLIDMGFELSPRLPVYEPWARSGEFLDEGLVDAVNKAKLKAGLRGPVSSVAEAGV